MEKENCELMEKEEKYGKVNVNSQIIEIEDKEKETGNTLMAEYKSEEMIIEDWDIIIKEVEKNEINKLDDMLKSINNRIDRMEESMSCINELIELKDQISKLNNELEDSLNRMDEIGLVIRDEKEKKIMEIRNREASAMTAKDKKKKLKGTGKGVSRYMLMESGSSYDSRDEEDSEEDDEEMLKGVLMKEYKDMELGKQTKVTEEFTEKNKSKILKMTEESEIIKYKSVDLVQEKYDDKKYVKSDFDAFTIKEVEISDYIILDDENVMLLKDDDKERVKEEMKKIDEIEAIQLFVEKQDIMELSIKEDNILFDKDKYQTVDNDLIDQQVKVKQVRHENGLIIIDVNEVIQFKGNVTFNYVTMMANCSYNCIKMTTKAGIKDIIVRHNVMEQIKNQMNILDVNVKDIILSIICNAVTVREIVEKYGLQKSRNALIFDKCKTINENIIKSVIILYVCSDKVCMKKLMKDKDIMDSISVIGIQNIENDAKSVLIRMTAILIELGENLDSGDGQYLEEYMKIEIFKQVEIEKKDNVTIYSKWSSMINEIAEDEIMIRDEEELDKGEMRRKLRKEKLKELRRKENDIDDSRHELYDFFLKTNNIKNIGLDSNKSNEDTRIRNLYYEIRRSLNGCNTIILDNENIIKTKKVNIAKLKIILKLFKNLGIVIVGTNNRLSEKPVINLERRQKFHDDILYLITSGKLNAIIITNDKFRDFSNSIRYCETHKRIMIKKGDECSKSGCIVQETYKAYKKTMEIMSLYEKEDEFIFNFKLNSLYQSEDKKIVINKRLVNEVIETLKTNNIVMEDSIIVKLTNDHRKLIKLNLYGADCRNESIIIQIVKRIESIVTENKPAIKVIYEIINDNILKCSENNELELVNCNDTKIADSYSLIDVLDQLVRTDRYYINTICKGSTMSKVDLLSSAIISVVSSEIMIRFSLAIVLTSSSIIITRVDNNMKDRMIKQLKVYNDKKVIIFEKDKTISVKDSKIKKFQRNRKMENIYTDVITIYGMTEVALIEQMSLTQYRFIDDKKDTKYIINRDLVTIAQDITMIPRSFERKSIETEVINTAKPVGDKLILGLVKTMAKSVIERIKLVRIKSAYSYDIKEHDILNICQLAVTLKISGIHLIDDQNSMAIDNLTTKWYKNGEIAYKINLFIGVSVSYMTLLTSSIMMWSGYEIITNYANVSIDAPMPIKEIDDIIANCQILWCETYKGDNTNNNFDEQIIATMNMHSVVALIISYDGYEQIRRCIWSKKVDNAMMKLLKMNSDNVLSCLNKMYSEIKLTSPIILRSPLAINRFLMNINITNNNDTNTLHNLLLSIGVMFTDKIGFDKLLSSVSKAEVSFDDIINIVKIKLKEYTIKYNDSYKNRNKSMKLLDKKTEAKIRTNVYKDNVKKVAKDDEHIANLRFDYDNNRANVEICDVTKVKGNVLVLKFENEQDLHSLVGVIKSISATGNSTIMGEEFRITKNCRMPYSVMEFVHKCVMQNTVAMGQRIAVLMSELVIEHMSKCMVDSSSIVQWKELGERITLFWEYNIIKMNRFIVNKIDKNNNEIKAKKSNEIRQITGAKTKAIKFGNNKNQDLKNTKKKQKSKLIEGNKTYENILDRLCNMIVIIMKNIGINIKGKMIDVLKLIIQFSIAIIIVIGIWAII